MYTCSLTLGDCSRACGASKDLRIVCVKLIRAVLPVTETSSKMRCSADQATQTPYWVGCSMLAFSYSECGVNLCRHFPQRYGQCMVLLSWRIIKATIPVCWYLSEFGIEVYALVPNTLNLFTPPSGMIVIFICVKAFPSTFTNIPSPNSCSLSFSHF